MPRLSKLYSHSFHLGAGVLLLELFDQVHEVVVVAGLQVLGPEGDFAGVLITTVRAVRGAAGDDTAKHCDGTDKCQCSGHDIPHDISFLGF